MLDERVLIDIKDLFVNIRFFARLKDDVMLYDNLKIIKEKRAIVNNLSTTFQKDILIYCFDNLILLIETKQYKFADDFSDAIHNLPEIFHREYNLKQYWKIYIQPLRKKYGNKLFIQFKNNFKGEIICLTETTKP